MRKILSILILGILFASCYNTGEPRKNVLKIYNWADYIGDFYFMSYRGIIPLWK